MIQGSDAAALPSVQERDQCHDDGEVDYHLDENYRHTLTLSMCSVVDQQGVTALCVTHRLEELRYADSASFMDGGRIQVSGTPEVIGQHMRKLGARAY